MLPTSASRRLVLIGLMVGLVVAVAGGAWAYGSHRYGLLLNEWRWRDQLRGAKTAGWQPPVSAGIGLAVSQGKHPSG
jgi:hypothetical protein